MEHIKPENVVGIDVSKLTIDVCRWQSPTAWMHKTLSNDVSGYRTLVKLMGPGQHFVMEATGIYHLKLAYYLTRHGFKVTVLNPLIIKRYRQMQLGRIKTDKADSKSIAQYGASQPLELWKAPTALLLKVQQEESLVSMLQCQRVQLINQLESLSNQPVQSKLAEKQIKLQLKQLEAGIKQLECSIIDQMVEEYKEEMQLLCSIPGISLRSAALLLMVTRGLSHFETAKQLSSYVGLTPLLSESGSSIRRKGRISKMGSSRLRRQLYMCSWSAIRFNDQCRSMYKRMKLSGKPGKVIMVAVMNKLLRQAFGVIKNREVYQAAA